MAAKRKGRPATAATCNATAQATPALGEARGRGPSSDAFLYSGQQHELVPQALLLDRRLTPLERNAWQCIRMHLAGAGAAVQVSIYEALRPCLAMVPCGANASTETVARALNLLRLTRWLSLVQRRRDARTGRILGNVYVLHDAPLTPFEAMELDEDYLRLVSDGLNHASKAAQRVAHHVLTEMQGDPLLQGRILPTRLQLLQQQMQKRAERIVGVAPGSDSEGRPAPRSESEDGPVPCSDSEGSGKTRENHFVRNPNEARIVSTVLKALVLTAGAPAHARAREHEGGDPGLELPPAWHRLKDTQRAGALAALQSLESPLRQAVLDEWGVRCTGEGVRNPGGYLFGLVQKALRGEFNAWAARTAPPIPTPMDVPANAATAARAPPMDRAEFDRRMATLLDVLHGRDVQ